jgi:hypothetical protein
VFGKRPISEFLIVGCQHGWLCEISWRIEETVIRTDVLRETFFGTRFALSMPRSPACAGKGRSSKCSKGGRRQE